MTLFRYPVGITRTLVDSGSLKPHCLVYSNKEKSGSEVMEIVFSYFYCMFVCSSLTFFLVTVCF